MSQVEMLAAAQREYSLDEIQPEALRVLEPGNEFLQEVVDQFGKTRRLAHKAQVACFYELKPSNVGSIVGKEDRMVGVREWWSRRQTDYIYSDLWSAKAPVALICRMRRASTRSHERTSI
jgi:hypothetical protein